MKKIRKGKKMLIILLIAIVAIIAIIAIIIAFGTIVSSLQSDRLTLKLGAGKVTAISVLLTAFALYGFSISSSFGLSPLKSSKTALFAIYTLSGKNFPAARATAARTTTAPIIFKRLFILNPPFIRRILP